MLHMYQGPNSACGMLVDHDSMSMGRHTIEKLKMLWVHDLHLQKKLHVFYDKTKNVRDLRFFPHASCAFPPLRSWMWQTLTLSIFFVLFMTVGCVQLVSHVLSRAPVPAVPMNPGVCAVVQVMCWTSSRPLM